MSERLTAIPADPPDQDQRGTAPIDLVTLLKHCMGNVPLVTMLFDKFDRQARADLIVINRALRDQDAGMTARVSHSLKGAAGALTAGGVQRAAAEIEQAAREDRLAAAEACLNMLAREVDRCLAYLPGARKSLAGADAAPGEMGGAS